MNPTDRFIARMVDVFQAPQTENPAGYIEETRRALAGWDERTLNQAADRLVKTAKFFPRPAEVIEVCEAIAAERVVPEVNAASNGPWSSAAYTEANRLINSPMGREAAKEGWIGQLHDYCREHRKLPNASRVADLKREARLFDEAYSACCAGKGGTLNDALKKLGESFLTNRNRLAAVAHGEKYTRTP